MKTISSRDNALYKELKHLAGSSQARRKAGRTLLDGVHLCQTYMQLRGAPPRCVVSSSALNHAEALELLARCEALQAECIVLPDNLYAPLSQVEHGVGILFVIETPQRAVPDTLQASAVLLDQLQDPGNVGSILRSAAASGITEVYCGPGTAFCWSPKVLRAAMGAHFVLDIFENVDLNALVDASGIAVLATSGYAEQCLYDMNLRRPVAWLLGHEGQGVSPALLAKATHRVAIPHRGQVESLNVAACAAVCFFEHLRQNQG